MKAICLAIFFFALGNALPQRQIDPPAGCRYECRLSYDTKQVPVTEEHCERQTREQCEQAAYGGFADICEPKTEELCKCRDEKSCQDITVHECVEETGINKFIYYEEEPRQDSITKCTEKWVTLDNGQKVWIPDPTGESCQTFLITRSVKVEKWREVPYTRKRCSPVQKRSCRIIKREPICETIESCNVKREPLDPICNAVTEKVCKQVHKLKTEQVVKRMPFLTCDGRLDGPLISYSDEEIFNINQRFPESRNCVSNEIQDDTEYETL